jgi:hypothetical protein
MVVFELLKFPIRASIDVARKIKINRLIWVIIWRTVIPGISFGCGLVKKEQFNQLASAFIDNVGTVGSNYLLKVRIDQHHQRLELAYSGLDLSVVEKRSIFSISGAFLLDNKQITIGQGVSFDHYTEKQNSEKDNRLKEIFLLRHQGVHLKTENDSFVEVARLAKKFKLEKQPLFPQVIVVSLSRTNFDVSDNERPYKMVAVWTSSINKLDASDKQRLRRQLEYKLGINELKASFIEN